MSQSPLRLATLVLLRKMVGDQTQICLAEKKRGFGVGKWNGIGGKVEADETIENAAVREAQEEVGVVIDTQDLQKVAATDFTFETNPEWGQQVHIFFVDHWQNEPIETEEMKPAWFFLDEIPYDQMWEDEKEWLPRVLHGEKLKAEFHFDSGMKIARRNILTVNLNELVL